MTRSHAPGDRRRRRGRIEDGCRRADDRRPDRRPPARTRQRARTSRGSRGRSRSWMSWCATSRATPSVQHVDLYLSGLDLPIEIERYRAAVAALPWARRGLVDRQRPVRAAASGHRRAGCGRVVCGTGINAVGVRGDGAVVRFPSLGPISGDWGGGCGLGQRRSGTRRGMSTAAATAHGADRGDLRRARRGLGRRS